MLVAFKIRVLTMRWPFILQTQARSKRSEASGGLLREITQAVQGVDAMVKV